MSVTRKNIAKKSVAFLVVASLLAPLPASAQFGGLFKKRSQTTEASSDARSDARSDDCDSTPKKSIGKSILGRMIGDMTGRATRGMGVVGSYIPRAEVAGVLTDSIACKLDPDEQNQAAEATLEVTRSEEVGKTAEWKSNTRDNVSGRSTITEKTELAGGLRCMNVADIVIVDGEETKVSKRMCKSPGQSRYEIVNV